MTRAPPNRESNVTIRPRNWSKAWSVADNGVRLAIEGHHSSPLMVVDWVPLPEGDRRGRVAWGSGRISSLGNIADSVIPLFVV